jgi:hypothetical protein
MAIGLVVALAVSCGTGPTPVPDSPPAPTVTCATVCQHGVELGCGWSTPTPAGTTCEAICLDAARLLAWNMACIQQAASCDGAEACQ